MRMHIFLLLGMLTFVLLIMPGIIPLPVAAENVTVTETPVVTTVTPAETPVPDQNVTVTETPVATNVTPAETPVPDQNVTPQETTPGEITITFASDTAVFNKFHIGDNDWSTGITVNTSYSSWYVKISDDTESASPGCMINVKDPSKHLAKPLLVKSIDTSSFAGVNPPLTIWTGRSPGTFTNTLYIRQYYGDTDPAGSYSINLQYQAGPL
jgi:hypothetical protein